MIVVLAVFGSCASGVPELKDVPSVLNLNDEKSENYAGMSHITISGAIRHGNKEVEVWMDTLAPGGAAPIHRHDCEQILVILKGTGTGFIAPISKENLPRQFTFSANSTFTFPPNVVHKVTNTGDVEDLQFLVVISKPPMISYIYKDWSTPHDEAILMYPMPWDREASTSKKDEL